MLYLANTFSLALLPAGRSKLDVKDVPLALVKTLLASGPWESIVGIGDLAMLYGKLLDMNIMQGCADALFTDNDIIIIGLYQGPQTPKGIDPTPDAANVRWLMISVDEHSVSAVDEQT